MQELPRLHDSKDGMITCLIYFFTGTNRKIVMQFISKIRLYKIFTLYFESLTETMYWFLACKWLFFAILLATNPAAAEEFQIQEPLGTILAEHSPVATDTGHTTGSRRPIGKPLQYPHDNSLTRFHAAYGPDQHYHEGWTKWFGFEGSTTGYCPHNIWEILNRRKPQ